MEGFSPDKDTYNVTLPVGTTAVPTVTATTASVAATMVITDATSLPGSTTVTVTAENNISQQIYVIYFSVEPDTRSPEKAITAFSIDSCEGTIDESTHSISTTVPYGTNVTSLTPTITISDNATISPLSGAVQDFTNPVIYTVTAENGTTQDYTVTVTVATLESIAITAPATKLVYTVGEDLDISGLVVTGTYSDSSTKTETVTAANITGFDSSAPAVNQVLTVTVGGKTTTYTVTINAAPVATLESIAITAPANKLVYTVGENLDISGLVVTGIYSDSSTKTETVTAANITGFDSSAPAGSQTLTVSVGGKTTTYTVTINAAPVTTLESIAITAPATKLIYTVGEDLDISGLVVTGTYSDSSTKTETVTTANVTGFDSSVPAASQTLTVTVGGKTATYTVTINAAPVATLESIAITIPATKLIYTVGEDLDISGLVVTGTYSDSSTKTETVTTANVTGFDSSVPAASQTLTVSVGGKTTTYTVTINAAPVATLESIAITTPATKLVYTVGEDLDISGLVVTGTYSDSSTKTETVTTANITGFNSSAPAASQTLTVTVGGKTTTYTVTINAAPVATLESIAITAPATKLVYTVGESLDISGLVVTGTYSDSSTKLETVTTANITGFDSSAPAVNQVLTVTVGGKTTTYTVTINAASSGGGSSGGGTSTTPPVEPPAGETPQTETTTTGNTATATTTTTATVDNSGKATAAVTQEQVSDAISQALAEAQTQGDGTAATVEIKVEAPVDATTVETSIPKDAVELAADGNTDALTVSTPIASISFDADALSTIAGEAAEDINITASKVEASSLSAEAQQAVGDRPVFNFSVTSGDKTISEFGGSVSVVIPYTPKDDEDTDAIVIYYINAEGNLEIVSNCIYDPETATVSFKTNHFSLYAIGYNKVSFNDVTANAWYGKAVGFIAARGITTGTGDGNYSPDAKLTRGEFLVMMMRAYGIAPDENPADNFADAGNTWYTGHLAAAKRLGISGGVGNNMFAPGKEITRQEMFTLLYNALKVINELPKGDIGKPLSSFSDAEQLASWAKDAMKRLVETGTISGSGGKLFPTDPSTRAEMAQVLYNLLPKQNLRL